VPTPVLHVIAGPNGAGKTTYFERILGPATRLPFVSADVIAQERWPSYPGAHGYEAAELAAVRRRSFIEERRSFATETVFSHPSKLDLLREAREAGYRVYLHVILVPEELAVQRVAVRVETGGHGVPEEKIRGRFGRLWQLVRQALALAQEAEVRDNSRAEAAFRLVARFQDGNLVSPADWPAWTPDELR
jgi:predicted ABC-type ATPase